MSYTVRLTVEAQADLERLFDFVLAYGRPQADDVRRPPPEQLCSAVKW